MDYNEIIPAVPDYESHRETLLKWLRVLYLYSILSLVVSIATAVAGSSTAATLIGAAVSLAAVVACFCLGPVNERYRKAAIFFTVSLGGSLLILVVPGASLISLAASVCSIIASYQELNAHSEITASKDAGLSRKWHSLFYWQLVIGIISGVATSAAVVIAVMADMDPEKIVYFTVLFTVLIGSVFALVRISCLKRTIALYQEESI